MKMFEDFAKHRYILVELLSVIRITMSCLDIKRVYIFSSKTIKNYKKY